MSNENAALRVKFEIGEIKFEAEGTADLVERERNFFMGSILPSAVEAVVRTRGTAHAAQYIEAVEQPTALLTSGESAVSESVAPIKVEVTDFSRTNLPSFLLPYGELTDQDFVLVAAYYDEKKNGTQSFTSESVKGYYAEARRTKYSNNSQLLQQLAKRGHIMDDPSTEKKMPKPYILTTIGIQYVETYQTKESGQEKPKTAKLRKNKNKQSSAYANLCADDLNLKNYPEIKNQNTFKKQMILTLYIVTTEDKGESFSVADIQYLLTDMLGLPATTHQIDGIFTKNKSWFKSEQDPNNKRAYKRKLLQGAKDFAQSIIDGTAK